MATILPLLTPEVQRKPVFNPLPFAPRLNICVMPSAMADTHSSDAISCGTISCVFNELMVLEIFGCIISEIFILIFMDLVYLAHMIELTVSDNL